jgi:hypothetical protein
MSDVCPGGASTVASPLRAKPSYSAQERVSSIPRRLTARRPAVGCFQCELRRGDKLRVKREDVEHGVVIVIGEPAVASLMRMAL